MNFIAFIYRVFEILAIYYFAIILLDVLASNKIAINPTSHVIHFQNEKPVIITTESDEIIPGYSDPEENLKKYLPPERVSQNDIKENSPLVDLGLETISGEPYTINAENLSKFINF